MPYKTYQAPAAKKNTRGAAAAAAAVVDPQATLADVKCEDAEMEDVTEETGTELEDGFQKKKPWLQRTKEGGVKKVPKDVQKRRRNYRLKKMLTPKAPIMVLHELLGQASVNYETVDTEQQTMRNMPQLFTVKAVYEDQVFNGMGPSKSIAKNVCAEHILQYITTKSCLKKPESEENQENGSPNSKNNRNQESDTPWVSLASLALFKLFNDWQSQGFEIPVEMMKGSSDKILNQTQAEKPPASQDNGGANNAKPKKAAVKAEKVLPDNPTEKHPVQLLNEMNGPLVYQQTGMTGTPPSCVFTLTVTVNETPFTGQGKSKKEAKKAAAQAALSHLWGVKYPETS